MSDERFDRVLHLIDAANAADPNGEDFEGRSVPKEWLYGRRMTAWLDRLRPDAPELLRIAARGQHIRRWEVPRENYPATREGYLKWRTFLYGFHGERAAELMDEAGYPPADRERVKALIGKRGLKTDPDAQTLEDVACLVFLEYHFPAFAATQAPDKLIAIVRKTWRKMSAQGHEAALTIPFPESIQALLGQALGAG